MAYYAGHGVGPHKLTNGDFIYLNGTNKSPEASWLAIEIPEPTGKAGDYRFIYMLGTDFYAKNIGQIGSVWNEKNGNDLPDSGPESWIYIYYDGRLESYGDAPKF